jgi:hypothetical protein
MKRINGEPVKLVESFDELKVGVVVFVCSCAFCGARAHRMMVIGGRMTFEMFGRCVEAAPVPLCAHAGKYAIAEETVHRREVYRVVDEKLDGETTTERAPRELERTR